AGPLGQARAAAGAAAAGPGAIQAVVAARRVRGRTRPRARLVVVSITRRHRRKIAIAVWSGASAALLGALAWAALAPAGPPWSVCPTPPAIYGPHVPQAVAVVVCVLAFFVGHVSCDLDPAPPRRVELAELAARLRRRRRIGPQAIVAGLLMLASVGLLGYE